MLDVPDKFFDDLSYDLISNVDKRSNLNKEQDKEKDPSTPLETSPRPSLQTPASSTVSYKSKTAKGKSKSARRKNGNWWEILTLNPTRIFM